jgi:YD repeat-containing protein
VGWLTKEIHHHTEPGRLGRQTQRQMCSVSLHFNPAGYLHRFEYDDLGRLKKIEYPKRRLERLRQSEKRLRRDRANSAAM